MLHRRELGALLKALRVEKKGLSVGQVADELGVSSSKVSRLEAGQRGISQQDIQKLCDLYGVDAEQRQLLTGLARESKKRAAPQPYSLPYSTYARLEAEATAISDYGLGVMPGLLQTFDYARAVLQAMVPRWVPDVVEQRVAGRMVRQQLLYSEHSPHFEAVVDESVLHRVVGSPAIMQAQLKRLLELSELPTVTIQVIPYNAGAVPAVISKFIILRFAPSTVSDVVFIEGLTDDLYLDDIHDVEVYNTTFRTLLDLAADPGTTREMITAIIGSYSARLSYLAER